MFRNLCARMRQRKIRQRSAQLLQPLPPRSGRYRLVGYGTLPDAQRLRLYVLADAPITPTIAIFAQPAPGRFDFDGQPLDLRPPPNDLIEKVRAHLLQRPVDLRAAGARFQPAA